MLHTKMIGNKIAEARKNMNLSQAQLGQRLFISPQAVGKWERGESLPDITTLNRLAVILGVDLNYFSESFQSGATEKAPEEPELRQPDEEPSARSEMPRWDMSRASWVDADFSGLKNLHEKFNSSNIKRCLFIGSELTGLLLKGNHVDTCDFSRSNMRTCDIQHSMVVNSHFIDGSLKGTTFWKSHIKGCDFTGTDLTAMVIKNSYFQDNTITNAVWNRTSFHGARLTDIVFNGTLKDCSFENNEFKRVTFQNATLINTFFKNQKLKKIRFVDCQADRMTYEFLKIGKADVSGISLVA